MRSAASTMSSKYSSRSSGRNRSVYRSSMRSVARSGLMIFRYAMISCFAFEMSRTMSSRALSLMSSSIGSSLWKILSRIGKQ